MAHGVAAGDKGYLQEVSRFTRRPDMLIATLAVTALLVDSSFVLSGNAHPSPPRGVPGS
jgi:hypothetical protein